jgi:hypothetical protein
MAVTFPHIQWTSTTDFMQDLYMLWIINKLKGWYVSNLQIFLTSKLKKKFLPLKVFGLLNYALYMRFIFILSNSYLQSLCCLFYLIGSTMPTFTSPCYLNIFGKVSRSVPINPPSFIFS